MVPAIAYQLANGARSVWAPVYKMQPLVEPRVDPLKTTAEMPAIHPSMWGSVKWEHHNLSKVRYIIVSAGTLTVSTIIGPLKSVSCG